MGIIRNISFTCEEFDNLKDLVSEDQELILAAKSVAGNAYAPYSGFRVGAAIRLESGRIVTGANVENAAFPSGICAERTALSYAVTNHPDDHPEAIAITAMNEEGTISGFVSPCGNCRQVITEEEIRTGRKIRIILYGSDQIRVIESCSQLLPLQFSKKNLIRDLP